MTTVHGAPCLLIGASPQRTGGIFVRTEVARKAKGYQWISWGLQIWFSSSEYNNDEELASAFKEIGHSAYTIKCKLDRCFFKQSQSMPKQCFGTGYSSVNSGIGVLIVFLKANRRTTDKIPCQAQVIIFCLAMEASLVQDNHSIASKHNNFSVIVNCQAGL
ncbi:hypothetical protein SUGI_1003700 [Cryptomeria japonica]|nr:hypothetical protein SUGI_1003700 [Cryptomeria japonica]